MALLESLGISEGLQVLLILFALIIVTLFLIRYLSFYFRYKRVRQENMELARHMKKELRKARLKPLDEAFDEQDDEMFKGPAIHAKAPVIPATYEARLSKTRKKAARKRAAAKKPGAKPRRKRARRSTSMPIQESA